MVAAQGLLSARSFWFSLAASEPAREPRISAPAAALGLFGLRRSQLRSRSEKRCGGRSWRQSGRLRSRPRLPRRGPARAPRPPAAPRPRGPPPLPEPAACRRPLALEELPAQLRALVIAASGGAPPEARVSQSSKSRSLWVLSPVYFPGF